MTCGSDLDEIIEVPSEWCQLDPPRLQGPCLRCVYGRAPGVECTHPIRALGRSVGCSDRDVMFLKRIEYLNWKLTGGSHE